MQPIIRALLASVAVALTVPNLSANPNHLEPINASQPDGYDQAVFNALIGRERGELWEICIPSFTVEYAVILRSQPETPKGESSAGQHHQKLKWFLEVATAAKSIWQSGRTASGEYDFRRDVKVERERAEIDQSHAEELQKTWLSVLSQTRSAREDGDAIADGVIYQFYIFPYFGQTHSPSTGSPAKLVKIASQLATAVKSDPAKREALLTECIRMAKELQANIQVHDEKPKGATRPK